MDEKSDSIVEKRDLFGALQHRSFDMKCNVYQMAGFSVSVPHLPEPRGIFDTILNDNVNVQGPVPLNVGKENENEKIFSSSSSSSLSTAIHNKNGLSLLSMLLPHEYTKALKSLNPNAIGTVCWSIDKASWILCDALKGFSSDLISLGTSKTVSICLPGYNPMCTRFYFHEFWKLFVLRTALDTSCKAFMTEEADRGQRALASTLSDMLVYFDASLTFLQLYITNHTSEISLSWLWVCTQTHRNILWEWFRCIASESVIHLISDAVDSDFLLGNSGFNVERIIGSHELMDINYWLQFSNKEWNLLQHLMEYMERHQLGSQTTQTFFNTSNFALRSCSILVRHVSVAVLKDIETVIFKWNLDPVHEKISVEEMIATLRVTSKSIWVNANNQNELLEQLLAALLWARTRVYIVQDSTFLKWLEDDEHLSFQMDGLHLELPILQTHAQQMRHYIESTRVKCNVFNQRIFLAIDAWDTPEDLSLVPPQEIEIEDKSEDDSLKMNENPIVEGPSMVSDSETEKEKTTRFINEENDDSTYEKSTKNTDINIIDKNRTLVSGPAVSAVLDSSLITEAKEMLKERYNKAIVEAERRATLAHWRIINRPLFKERRSMLSTLYLNESKAWSMRMSMNIVPKDITDTTEGIPRTKDSIQISQTTNIEKSILNGITLGTIDEKPTVKSPIDVLDKTHIVEILEETSAVKNTKHDDVDTEPSHSETLITVISPTEASFGESTIESQTDVPEAPEKITIKSGDVAVELPAETPVETTIKAFSEHATKTVIAVPTESTMDVSLSPAVTESPQASAERIDLKMFFRDSIPHLNWSEIMENTGNCIKCVSNMLECACSNTSNSISTIATKHDDAHNSLSLIESKSMIAQVVEAKCYFLDISTLSYLVIDKGLLTHVNVIEDSFLLSRRSSFIFDFSVALMECFSIDNMISPQDYFNSADVLCTQGLWSQSNVRKVLSKLGHLDTMAWIDIDEEIVTMEYYAGRKTSARDHLFSFEGLDRLTLIYRCVWPMNVVFGEEIFQKITVVTRRLLQLLQLKWLSNFIWQKIRATRCNNRDIFSFFQRIQHNIQAIIEFTHDCIRSLQIKFRKDLRNDMHGGVANFIHKLNSYIDNISASVFVSVGGSGLSNTLDALLHDTLTVLSIIDKYLDHQCDLLDLTKKIKGFHANKIHLTKILLREVNEELDENIVASINSLIIRLDTFHT